VLEGDVSVLETYGINLMNELGLLSFSPVSLQLCLAMQWHQN